MDKLSRMAANARAMGLSYGKYMALRSAGATPAPLARMLPYAPEEDEPPERRCGICGKKLRPDAPKRALTCGPICSYELNKRRNRDAYKRKHKLDEMGSLTCPGCGKSFRPGKRGQRFCSRSCSVKARRARLRAQEKGEKCH